MELQLETVLIALGAIVALVVLVKFGRAIGRFVLALAGIAAVVVVGLAILAQGAANFQTAKAAQDAAQAVKVSSVGQTLAIGAIAALVVALVGALGLAGFLALRWRLAERQRLQRRDLACLTARQAGRRWLPGPGALWGRQMEQPAPTVVYIAQDPQAGDLAPLGDGWGFGEVEEWTSDDWQF
jgi:hypothetical protein